MFISTAIKLQKYINLSLHLTLVGLCRIKCNNPVNFYFSLYRLHRRGWMATKFTRPQPTWLSLWVQCFRHFTNFTQSQRPFRS